MRTHGARQPAPYSCASHYVQLLIELLRRAGMQNAFALLAGSSCFPPSSTSRTVFLVAVRFGTCIVTTPPCHPWRCSRVDDVQVPLLPVATKSVASADEGGRDLTRCAKTFCWHLLTTRYAV